MRKRILPFVNLLLLCVVSAGNATIPDNNNAHLSAVESHLKKYTKLDEIRGFTGIIRQIDNDNSANSLVNSLAQNNTSQFIVYKKDVEFVQRALKDLGYDVGNVDGLAHIRTVKAIIKLQQDKGLPVTGEIDQPLLDFLKLK